MAFTFYKYHGTGNDFILLDNRDGHADKLTQASIAAWCHRRFGIGADGLMLLGTKDGYDFTMAYFNADGAPGSMCGNGARCIVRFAADMGIVRDRYRFLAPDGDHEAELLPDGGVRLWMTDVDGMEEIDSDVVLNTGSPHYVKFVDGLEDMNVDASGRAIRNSDRFRTNGINVNFVEPKQPDSIFVRTFERGVEAETYSCGTGVTACALVSVNGKTGMYTIGVDTLGGRLKVDFECIGPESFRNIRLSGPATFVFKGEIEA